MDFKIAVRLLVPLALSLYLSACASTQGISSPEPAPDSQKQNEDDDLYEVFALLSQSENQLDVFLGNVAAELYEEADKEEQINTRGMEGLTYRLEGIKYDPDKYRLRWKYVTTTQDIRIIPHHFHEAVCDTPFYSKLLKEFDVSVVQDIYYNNVKEGDIVVTECK